MSIARALLVNSIVGNMWFLFTRRHMKELEVSEALVYSTLGSVLFNFGSILFWSIGRFYLPENDTLLVGFGIVSGALLLAQARSYLRHVDAKHL